MLVDLLEGDSLFGVELEHVGDELLELVAGVDGLVEGDLRLLDQGQLLAEVGALERVARVDQLVDDHSERVDVGLEAVAEVGDDLGR